MNEYEINNFVNSLSDDEFQDMTTIRSESYRISEIKPSKKEWKHAKDIYVYLNKKISVWLKDSNQPLTILCFSDSQNKFTFSRDYQNFSAPFDCSNSTLIMLKALYEGTMPTSTRNSTIIPIPVQEPEHGVKLYLSLTFGSNK